MHGRCAGGVWRSRSHCRARRLRQAQAEIERVLGDRALPALADIPALGYVMRCVNESMRLYPHPPVLLRRAQAPDVLPGRALGPLSGVD